MEQEVEEISSALTKSQGEPNTNILSPDENNKIAQVGFHS